VKEILKEKWISEPRSAQLKNAVDKIEVEQHAILFLYRADKARYGKLTEQMKNDML